MGLLGEPSLFALIISVLPHMNVYHYFGLEIDLISEYELLEAIELSAQLPQPEEQSIFCVKDPNDWLLAGQEVRQAFREELPHQLSELGSAFLIQVLQEHGEGYSDLMVEWNEGQELAELLTGPYVADFLRLLDLPSLPGQFRQVKGKEPFGFIHVPYDQLIELDIPDWEAEIPPAWQALLGETPEPLSLRWLQEIGNTIADLQVVALERDGTPALFIYPVIFPEMVYEVEEDEPPHATMQEAMRWLRHLEQGHAHAEGPADPFLRYQLLRYLEQQAFRLQQSLQEQQFDALKAQFQADPRSIQFAEQYALPDFSGQPRELILALLNQKD
jgi:hypothetical protein